MQSHGDNIFYTYPGETVPHHVVIYLGSDKIFQAPQTEQYRVRFDIVDQFGKVTLRHGGILHHLGVGNTRRGVKILLLIDEESVTVTDRETGEVLSEHAIDDARNYWRNRLREPGRWPG